MSNYYSHTKVRLDYLKLPRKPSVWAAGTPEQQVDYCHRQRDLALRQGLPRAIAAQWDERSRQLFSDNPELLEAMGKRIHSTKY